MFFKQNRNKVDNSVNYKFSVMSTDEAEVVYLKELVKEHNAKDGTKKKYVQVRPRGPRFGRTHNTIMANARYFDVYIQTRYQ